MTTLGVIIGVVSFIRHALDYGIDRGKKWLSPPLQTY